MLTDNWVTLITIVRPTLFFMSHWPWCSLMSDVSFLQFPFWMTIGGSPNWEQFSQNTWTSAEKAKGIFTVKHCFSCEEDDAIWPLSVLECSGWNKQDGFSFHGSQQTFSVTRSTWREAQTTLFWITGVPIVNPSLLVTRPVDIPSVEWREWSFCWIFPFYQHVQLFPWLAKVAASQTKETPLLL